MVTPPANQHKILTHRRCTGVIYSQAPKAPNQAYCNRYYCPKHGQQRVWNDCNGLLKNGLQRLKLPPSQVFIARFSLPLGDRVATSEDLALLKQRLTRLFGGLQALARRQKQNSHYFLIYVIGKAGVIHAHAVLTFIPDATSKAGKWFSPYLARKAGELGLTFHYAPIYSTYEAIVGYFYENLIASLPHDYPPNFRRVSYSAHFKPRVKQLTLPITYVAGNQTGEGGQPEPLPTSNQQPIISEQPPCLMTGIENRLVSGEVAHLISYNTLATGNNQTHLLTEMNRAMFELRTKPTAHQQPASPPRLPAISPLAMPTSEPQPPVPNTPRAPPRMDKRC